MKIIKGLLLFGLVVVGVSSCFDPPEFSNTPKIDLDGIYYGADPDPFNPDSIVLSIHFQDGDGDLGLENNPEENMEQYLTHTSDPFHPVTYFLAKDGELTPVTTFTGISNENPPRTFTPLLNVPEGVEGKLATDRIRNDPQYSHLNLEPNQFPDKCYHYTEINLYVLGDDVDVIDTLYKQNIVDTLTEFAPPVYVVRDAFYTERNPNNYNIQVDWYKLNPSNGQYEFFKWEEVSPANGCSPNFNGRFPVASQSDNALEGIIRYSMKSVGFEILFGGATQFTLKIQIKDRAFNTSNIIETEPMTLQEIRRL